MFQVIDCNLLLYIDVSCLIYQKTTVKTTLFSGTKKKVKKDSNLDINYDTIHIRQ